MNTLSDIVNGTYKPSQSQQSIQSDFSRYTVILTDDLTFDVPAQGESNFAPIGKDKSYTFNGTFDGQGHTISNLIINVSTIDEIAYAGLFGYVGKETGYREIAPCVKNVSIIGESSITANSTGSYTRAGGIVGENHGTIENCYYTGTVNVTASLGAYAGGIAGFNSAYGGIIKNCYNDGTINASDSASEFVGGIAGQNSGIIKNCYNTGTVHAISRYTYIGGIVGLNGKGTMENCYNTGDVTATSSNAYVGGIAGKNEEGTMENCYNTGDVTATSSDAYAGGIAGENEKGSITNCYAKKVNSQGLVENGSYTDCDTFEDNGKLTTDGGKTLLDALNEWVKAEYDENSGMDYKFWKDSSAENTPAVFCDTWQEVTEAASFEPSETISDPYQLANMESSESYSLSNNIDLSLYNWDPVGNQTNQFQGTFNGNEYVISNMRIIKDTNEIEYSGLFGYIGNTGKVMNVILEHISINIKTSSSPAYVGGIAGYNDGGVIENCYNTEDVTATSTNSSVYAGGIAGYNSGIIINCYSTGAVSGSVISIDSDTYVGGIAGYNDGGAIENCYNTGAVSGTTSSGGIIGYNSGTVTNCYNTGEITSSENSGGISGDNSGIIINCYNRGEITSSENSGGISGDNSGTITNCYNTGAVTGSTHSGGIAGSNSDNGTIENCYNTGSVTGSNSGGIIGYNSGTVTNCYNTGEITSSENSGGISGDNSGTITNCYWSDNIPNGVGSGPQITYNNEINDGKIDTEGKVSGTFLHTLLNNWVVNNSHDDIMYYLPWTEDPYPEFKTHPAVNNKIYEIRTAIDLTLVNNDLDGNYALLNDIDLSVYKKWTPIGGSDLFNGTFNGNGYTISNMTITGDLEYAGLFGCIGEDGIVKNVGLVESSINLPSSDDVYSGGIAGNNSGTIINCYNTGSVTGSNSGGIIGYNSGTVTNCYNRGEITSSENSGGIIGYNSGTITNCYNTGTVSGTTSSGGIAGINSGTITNCYWSDNIPNGVGSGPQITYNNEINDGKIDTEGKVSGTFLHIILNEWVNTNYENDRAYYLPWTEDPLPKFKAYPHMENGIYEIRTASDLTFVNHDLNGSYILLNDIDLSVYKKWTPIGGSAEFNGTFNGNGYTISNMTITGDLEYAGLFGCIGEDGIVKNVGLVESSINIPSSNDVYSGGIAGSNAGEILNCYNTGPIESTTTSWDDTSSGGITGINSGTIINCYNTGDVTATAEDDDANSGGITGINSGTIENCYNTGAVTATTYSDDSAYSGGIAGENWELIINCYNTGDVTAIADNDNAYSGGITGSNLGTIENCYNAGRIESNSANGYPNSGGITGDNSGTIENCYNTGAVNTTDGYASLGGIAGENWELIINCYNSGAVTAISTASSTNSNVYSGGIAGYNYIEEGYVNGTILNTFYLKSDNITGIGNEDDDGKATPLDSNAMMGLKLLGGEGSINNLNVEQDQKPWSPDIFGINNGYPILADVPLDLGNKTPRSAVYILSETEDAQTDNYLEMRIGAVLSAKTIETVWEGPMDPRYSWYIYGSDESQGSDATINIAEPDKLIVYYVTISYNIDGVEYKYTSLTRSVCNTQSTPPQPPPTPPPYDPTPGPTPDPEPEPEPIVPDENNNITVPPIDEEKTEELINEAVSSGSDSIPLIDTSNVEGEYTEVTVSKSDLETVSKKIENNNNINSVSIETSEGDIILEKEVLNSILETTDADSVSFEIEDAKDKLTEEQKEAVGDRPVYDINITAGNENITSFNGKTITISLPYTLKEGEDPENIVVYYVKEDGSLEKVNCTYKDGKVVFETDHLSKYVIGYEESEPVTPDTPDDKKDDNNTIYYAVAAIVIVLIIIALAYYFMKKKQ